MSGSSIDGAASPSEYGMQQILSSGETTLLVVLPDGDTRSMPAIREKGVYLQKEFASIGRWIVALDEHTGGGRGSSRERTQLRTFNSDLCQGLGWCQKPSKHNNRECNIHSLSATNSVLNRILW